MAYADYEFYKDIYMGDVLTDDTANIWLQRASDAVNRATRSKIVEGTTTDFQWERIKYAVCITADFLASLGDSATSATVQSYTIGDVSMSLSDGDKQFVESYGIPKRAYDELIQTGLLYLGV